MKPAVEFKTLQPTDKFHEVRVNYGLHACWQATFVMDMIRSGMLAAIPSSQETGGGHQVTEIMPVEEVVKRAFALADLTLVGFAQRGWTIEMPSFDEMRDTDGVRAGFRADAS